MIRYFRRSQTGAPSAPRANGRARLALLPALWPAAFGLPTNRMLSRATPSPEDPQNLKTPPSRSRLASAVTQWAAAAAIALMALCFAPQADAAYVLTLQESGGNVVGTGSGTLNTAAFSGNNTSSGVGRIRPSVARVVTGPQANNFNYSPITGPPPLSGRAARKSSRRPIAAIA